MFLINDLFYGYISDIYDVLSIIAIISGILIITVKNPVVSVLFLISLFMSIALYLMFFGIGFIGLAYLLVYVGAVSMLFLFILMLINIRVSELISDTKNSIPLVFLVTIIFANADSVILPQFSIKEINTLFGVTWEATLGGYDAIVSIGNIMYGTYSIWLLQVSLILLVAMVGAIVININKSNTILYTPSIPYIVNPPLKSIF